MVELTPDQCRVIGVMLEKEITTPDQYPLSLNALASACNQKSNREPVVNYSQGEIQTVIDHLIDQALIIDSSDFNSRTAKFQHRFCNTEFSDRQFNEQEFAIICILLLRGPQTPGELKSRSGRLCQFENSLEVERCLQTLADKNGVNYVQQLQREPGKRESRFAHCFSDQVPSTSIPFIAQPLSNQASTSAESHSELEEKVRHLEDKVMDLESRLEILEQALI